MGESVNYAELQFSKAPLGQTVRPQIQETEPRWSMWPLLLVLLAACLALLATTIVLGVCYWQVSTALVQSQDQLAETRAEGDCSQKKLQGRGTELQKARAAVGKVQKKLAWMQGQVQDLQEQLNKTAGDLACSRADCCPETWVLHRGKCLFLSKEKKTWLESLAACAANFSRLLVLRDWDLMTMPSFFTNMDTSYWIGLRYNRVWTWIDGTPYPQGPKSYDYVTYGTIKRGRIEPGGGYSKQQQWVCEKPSDCPQGATEMIPQA